MNSARNCSRLPARASGVEASEFAEVARELAEEAPAKEATAEEATDSGLGAFADSAL